MLTINEHGSRQQGAGRQQNGTWVKHETSRPQTRRSDSTYPIIYTALSHGRGMMGFFSRFFFFPALTRCESVTDSYLHWLTLRELAACWGGVAGLIDCLLTGWWLASKETACLHRPLPFFSSDRLESLNPAGMFWQRFMNWDNQCSVNMCML